MTIFFSFCFVILHINQYNTILYNTDRFRYNITLYSTLTDLLQQPLLLEYQAGWGKMLVDLFNQLDIKSKYLSENLFKAVDHSTYVSGFSCTTVASISVTSLVLSG